MAEAGITPYQHTSCFGLMHARGSRAHVKNVTVHM